MKGLTFFSLDENFCIGMNGLMCFFWGGWDEHYQKKSEGFQGCSLEFMNLSTKVGMSVKDLANLLGFVSMKSPLSTKHMFFF